MNNVKTKQAFYALYQQGHFGNKLLSWNGYDSYLRSGYEGLVSVRYMGEAGGGCARYNQRREDVDRLIEVEGLDSTRMQINESAPDEFLIWQGELTNQVGGWYLRYSRAKAKMRDAMKDAIVAEGLSVLMLMRGTMTPSSYDDVMCLFDLYPNSVVELSVYEICLGEIRGRNTLVWEVREY